MSAVRKLTNGLVGSCGRIVGDWGESSTKLAFAKNIVLSLAGIDLPAQTVHVVSLAKLESRIGHEIDGIVGADLFKRYAVTIDYAVEIRYRIVRPQPVLDFVAGNNLVLTFKEHSQDLKDLFSEESLIIRTCY